MAVGGSEAPGAGSANTVVADNTPPANVAPGNPPPAGATGQGSAGSPGGPLPPVSAQPGRRTDAVQAGPLPPDAAARIGKALIHLNEAEKSLSQPTEAATSPPRPRQRRRTRRTGRLKLQSAIFLMQSGKKRNDCPARSRSRPLRAMFQHAILLPVMILHATSLHSMLTLPTPNKSPIPVRRIRSQVRHARESVPGIRSGIRHR